MFEFKINPVTNRKEAQFQGKLISISDDVVGTTPKGKDYYVGSVEFENANKQKIQRSCIINAANYDYGMTVGNTYLCTVSLDAEKGALITMSHLTQAARASFDDFGAVVEDVAEKVENSIESLLNA